MTKAKLLTVALLATTILLFAGSINALVDSSGGTAHAGTLFRDDFSDGSILDDAPVSWGGSPLNIGDATLSDGSLKLSPNNQTKLDGTLVSVGPERVISRDMSVRTQLRVGKDGDTATILSRIQPNGRSFAAAVGYDTNLGGSYVALGKPAGDTVGETEFQPCVLGTITPLLPFDVRQQDAVLQLDMIGDEVTVWAWQAGRERPEEPFFRLTDATFSEPGFPAIGVLVGKPGANLNDHGATFRFVQVANTSIPEPSSGSLAMFGMSVLFGVMSRRRVG